MPEIESNRMRVVNVVTALSFVLASLCLWYFSAKSPLYLNDLFTLLVCVLLSIFAEVFNIEIPEKGIGISIGFSIEFAVLILFGPVITSIVTVTSTILSGLQRKLSGQNFWKLLYNISINIVTLCGVWWIYRYFGGSSTSIVTLNNVVAITLASICYFFLNSVSIIGIASYIYGLKFLPTWYSNAIWAFPTHVALTTLAVLLAEIYLVVSLPGVLLLIIPLLFARYSLSEYLKAKKAHLGIIQAFAKALEAKDPYTKGHSDRVSYYTEIIAQRMKLSPEYIKRVTQAAQMHDIGKIGVPELILNKPNRLDDSEFQLIMQHPLIGADIVSNVEFLAEMAEIIKYHHEWFNGEGGYPRLCNRGQIPLGARILMIADSFDAMTSDRPYRKALSIEDALNQLGEGSGTQFDPEIVETFFECIEKGDLVLRDGDSGNSDSNRMVKRGYS